ncbi:hypothetical protein ACFLZX_04955 [Nanoarchaeota archaeon]
MSEEIQKLEKEENFLKESYDAGIISEDEYETKLREIEERKSEVQEPTDIPEPKEEPVEESKDEAIDEEPEEESKDEAIDEEPVDDKKEEVVEEKPVEEKEDEVVEEKPVEEEPPEVKEVIAEVPKEEDIPIKINIDKKEEQQKLEEAPKEEVPKEEEKSESWKWAVAALLVVLLLFVLFSEDNATNDTKDSTGDVIADINDSEDNLEDDIKDVPKEEDPNKVDSVIKIINDESCEFCDTARMKKVLDHLFPGVEFEEMDISEAGTLGSSLKSLPAYVFEENIVDADNFGDFKRTLEENGDVLIMKSSASGSPYYFKRDAKEATLEVFVNLRDPSIGKVEKLLEEIDLIFGDELNATLNTYSQGSRIADQLDLTASPTFFVNNQMKFTGISTASLLKENICSLNDLESC